jgi:hypothetical protein
MECSDVRHKKSVLATLSLAALLAGVAGGCLITYDPDGVELAETDTTPRLAIVSPTAGEVVQDCLRVRVNYFNLELVDPATHPDPVDGQGHYHIEIDGNPLGQNLALTGAGVDVPLRILNFAKGREHSVTIRTENNDNTPHAVIQPARVTWTAGWDPADGSTTSGRCVVAEGTGGGL